MVLDTDRFYDESRIAIIPMGYCYPAGERRRLATAPRMRDVVARPFHDARHGLLFSITFEADEFSSAFSRPVGSSKSVFLLLTGKPFSQRPAAAARARRPATKHIVETLPHRAARSLPAPRAIAGQWIAFSGTPPSRRRKCRRDCRAGLLAGVRDPVDGEDGHGVAAGRSTPSSPSPYFFLNSAKARSRTTRSSLSLSREDCLVLRSPSMSIVRMATPSKSMVTALGCNDS